VPVALGDADDERIPLTPKAFAVLRYLVEHAGRLVTQNEALWPDTFVQPEVLNDIGRRQWRRQSRRAPAARGRCAASALESCGQPDPVRKMSPN
jgi:DNA-binding response OmpR family regulator